MADFRRFYPGEYRHACYPTRDHIIPFREFWMLYECIGHIEARERLESFRALTNAIACCFAEKGAPLLDAVKDDLVAAYLAPPEPGERKPLIEVVSR